MSDESELFTRWKRDAMIAVTAGAVSSIMIGFETVVTGHVGDPKPQR